jgi:hypothetical protein
MVKPSAKGDPQVTLLVAAAGGGVFFGLYYNFLILIPVTLVAMIVCSASALLGGYSMPSALFATIIPTIGLQGGYMVGVTGRDLFAQLLIRLNGGESKRA